MDGREIMEHLSRILKITHPLDAATEVAGRDRAAVVLIIHDSQGLDAVFVKRKASISDPWSGQIALPGGRFGPQDTSILDTAIRETIEETGIDLLSRGRLIGILEDVSPANVPSLVVTPFVALVGDKIPATPGAEIDEVFWVPLRKLQKIRYQTILKTGAEWRGDAFKHQAYLIWGLTGHIINRFLTLLQDSTC